jgi:UPF0176 protein
LRTFPNAIDPQTDSFRQFQDFAEHLAETGSERPVAMFCTGGIRCEKAAALMRELGFDEVYQLKGGILSYLGGYVQCHACRRPLSSEDLASPDYREGVSCPRCVGTLDEDRASRLEERRKQVALARKRGVEHIGAKLE